MRKLILLYLSACLLLSACGVFNKIEINTNSKGVRTVLTSSRSVCNNIKIALGARSVNAKDTVVAILITSTKDSEHGLFDRDDLLQIKLTDNSVINLKNIYDKEYNKETTTTTTTYRNPAYNYAYCYGPFGEPYIINTFDMYSMVPVTTTSTTTYSYALYLVTGQQIVDMMTKGIIKVRIENEEGYIDIPNPVRMQDVIKGEVEDLVETFFNDPKAGSDNF